MMQPAAQDVKARGDASGADAHGSRPLHRIAINLENIGQLFNSMDPSPFYEKDLDQDAEEFIMSWAQEFPRKDPVMLIIHLAHPVKDEGARKAIGDAVRHYFAYRKRLNRRELKRLWRDGRESLLIGLSFLAACTLTAGLLPSNTETWWNVVREGLTIAGWVALWRPMQIYLYDWWPLRRRGQIFEKMSRMQVQISARKPGIQPSRKSVSGGETANSFEEHP